MACISEGGQSEDLSGYQNLRRFRNLLIQFMALHLATAAMEGHPRSKKVAKPAHITLSCIKLELCLIAVYRRTLNRVPVQQETTLISR